MKILKRIHIVISIMLMLVLAGSNLSFAQVKMENNSEIDFIREIKNESFSADKEHLRYIENAVSSKEMNDIILKYQKKYSNSQAYTMFKKNLKNIYEEGQANNFSETQIKALFIAAANLETSDTFDDKTNYSAEIPDFAPSHAEEFNFENVNRPYSNFKEGLLNNSDKSQRTSYETAGIGYEVRSTPGYNQTTTFLNPGRCNVTAPKGKAGYMFYTIYCEVSSVVLGNLIRQFRY